MVPHEQSSKDGNIMCIYWLLDLSKPLWPAFRLSSEWFCIRSPCQQSAHQKGWCLPFLSLLGVPPVKANWSGGVPMAVGLQKKWRSTPTGAQPKLLGRLPSLLKGCPRLEQERVLGLDLGRFSLQALALWAAYSLSRYSTNVKLSNWKPWIGCMYAASCCGTVGGVSCLHWVTCTVCSVGDCWPQWSDVPLSSSGSSGKIWQGLIDEFYLHRRLSSRLPCGPSVQRGRTLGGKLMYSRGRSMLSAAIGCARLSLMMGLMEFWPRGIWI